ncbi:MAG: universal stress protein, partial [Saprospiraceae bacterium]|nr:universal stress protein [Saprospiraceae bacterium]
ERIKEFLTDLGDRISGFASDVAKSIQDFVDDVRGFFERGVEGWQRAWEGLGVLLATIWEGIKATISTAIDNIWTGVLEPLLNWLQTTFGGVTVATMARAHMPVLIIPGATRNLAISTVCYAADLCNEDPYHIWETSQLLQPLSPLLRVVHVRAMREEQTDLQLEQLKDYFASRSPVLQVSFHEEEGDHVWTALNSYVDNHDVDLLVMHTPHRSFLERLRHQSQTRQMSLHSHVPLLVLK